MKIDTFKIERYYAKYELTTKYLLSNSDCDGFPLSYLLERLDGEEKERWDNLVFNYTEPQGLPELREAIARQYQTIAAADVVVITPGEANFSFMNLTLDKGDHAICMFPAYQSLYQIATNLGCELSFWEPQPGTWTFRIEDLKKLVTPKTKVLIVNFPHNPTGYLPTKDEMLELAAFAREHQLLVWSDEMYHQLLLDDKDAIPAFCDIYENAVSLWALSKTFGLASMRLGWIATRNEQLKSGILGFKDYLSLCTNAMSEIMALMVLKKKDEFIKPNQEKIVKNLEIFNAFCARHPDFIEWIPPKAGSVGFLKLKNVESTLDYCNELREAVGVMMLPSEILGYKPGYVRIGLGRDDMADVLAIWEDYIVKQKQGAIAASV